MHPTQQKLLDLIAERDDFGSLSYRKMAKLIGEEGKPQTVIHHLERLEMRNLIQMNKKEGEIKLVKRGYQKRNSNNPIYSVPIVGAANCGDATLFAEENIERFLKVSKNMLPYNKKNLFALVAKGNSMNKAEVEDGKTIENGDFVFVDKEMQCENGDIVVAVIDGAATIKRYRFDKKNNRVVLEPESTEDHLPIYLDEDDDFLLNGKVVGIIKRKKNNHG